MKLFYAPGSSSLLPHIVLHEAELPFEPIKIDEHTKAISGGSDYRSVNPLFYKGMPEEGRDVFRTRLRARFTHLDRHLSSNECVMGRDYWVADAHFFVVSNWASWVDFDLSPYSAVLAHRQRVGSRPAVIAALEAEGLVPWPATQPP